MIPNQYAQRTDNFAKKLRQTVPVGTLTTVVLPSTTIRGYDSAVVFLDNLGTDTLNATMEFSPDGTFPGATDPNDAFAGMAPGTSRYAIIPTSAQFFRIVGAFDSVAGDVTVSLILQRNSR